MASARLSQTALAVGLHQSLATIDEVTAGIGIDPAARAAARQRALALFGACGGAEAITAYVQLVYSSELLSLIAVDLAADPARTRRIIDRLAQQAGLTPVALGREILGTARLLELTARTGIEVRLALLLAFSRARSASLWTHLPGGQPAVVSRAGAADADHELHRQTVTAVLASEESEISRPSDETFGLRLDRLGPSPSALVLAGVTAPGPVRLLAAVAVPALGALLDREEGSQNDGADAEAILSSVERRLARLRFDLHDGPQQDVHLLAQDLALFREQLRPMISGDPNADRLLGRLDDLEAQLVALDGDLRRLSSAVESPFLAPGSLAEGLRQITESFASRTGIRPETTLRGSMAQLTDSQQIALLALVREALSNIRKHSGARSVSIAISADRAGIHAEVQDDGNGFDPEAMLVRAARAGRLGLVGMHERVRMLGGRTQIDSRAGGPTVISANLPPWPRAEP